MMAPLGLHLWPWRPISCPQHTGLLPGIGAWLLLELCFLTHLWGKWDVSVSVEETKGQGG